MRAIYDMVFCLRLSPVEKGGTIKSSFQSIILDRLFALDGANEVKFCLTLNPYPYYPKPEA